MRTILIVLIALFSSITAIPADEFSEAGRRLAVDAVQVKNRGELRGVVLGQSETGLRMAVRRDWLQSRSPKWLQQIEKEAESHPDADPNSLLERIDSWIQELETQKDPNRQLIATISLAKNELAKSKPDAGDNKSRFVQVDIPLDSVRRKIVQTPETRQLALVGWELNITNVEGLPALRLKEAVAQADKDWMLLKPEIAKELPASTQSETEWALRKAIWEYQFGTQVTFQGTGNSIFRTDQGDARPQLAEIIPSILKSSALGDVTSLLNGTSSLPAPPAENLWQESVIQQAEKASVRCFRVTMVKPQVEQNLVRVESMLVARGRDGKWVPVWQESITENGAVNQKEAEDRIRQDPQLEQVLQLASTLGVQGEVDRAIRFGANTMVAQQKADTRFRQWIESVTRSLDRPAISALTP